MCPPCDLSRLCPRWISCSGAQDSSESRVANAPPLAVCVGRHQKNPGPVLVLVASLRVCPPLGAASDPPSPTSLLFLSSLSMTSVKRTSLPESFPSTRVERRASRRPATWSVSTAAAGRRAGLLLVCPSVRPSVRQTGRLLGQRQKEKSAGGWPTSGSESPSDPPSPSSPSSPCGAKLTVRQRCGSADPSALCLSLALSNVVSSGCFLLFSRLC